MTAKMLPALAGVLALSVPNVFAQFDDDSKKAARSAEPVQLILSQSEEPKKPKKPKDEARPSKEVVAQSEGEPKKPKKPKDEAQPYQQVVAQSDDEPKKPKKPEGPDVQS